MIFSLMDSDILVKDLRRFGVSNVNMSPSNTIMGHVGCLICPWAPTKNSGWKSKARKLEYNHLLRLVIQDCSVCLWKGLCRAINNDYSMVQTDTTGFTEPKSGQFYVMSSAQLESTRKSSRIEYVDYWHFTEGIWDSAMDRVTCRSPRILLLTLLSFHDNSNCKKKKKSWGTF